MRKLTLVASLLLGCGGSAFTPEIGDPPQDAAIDAYMTPEQIDSGVLRGDVAMDEPPEDVVVGLDVAVPDVDPPENASSDGDPPDTTPEASTTRDSTPVTDSAGPTCGVPFCSYDTECMDGCSSLGVPGIYCCSPGSGCHRSLDGVDCQENH